MDMPQSSEEEVRLQSRSTTLCLSLRKLRFGVQMTAGIGGLAAFQLADLVELVELVDWSVAVERRKGLFDRAGRWC